MLSVEELKEKLRYDADTGYFIRIKSKHHRMLIGRIAGSVNHGYIVIRINNKKYKAHRLAWLYVYGEWPCGFIDHINGIRKDNRISNLRVVDRYGNASNQKCHREGKPCGVSYNASRGKWVAKANRNCHTNYLGTYSDKDNAVKAYNDFVAGFKAE